MGLLKDTATLSFLNFLSRLSGFLREILFARTFQTTYLADSFIVAFRLPNLFRSVFAEGAASNSLIPLFKEAQQKNQFWALIYFAFKFLLASSGLMCALLILFPDFFLWLIAGGLSEESKNLAQILTRLMAPYLVAVTLLMLVNNILSFQGFFVLSSSYQILLNLLCSAALLVYMLDPLKAVYGLTGVILGLSCVTVLTASWYITTRSSPVTQVDKSLSSSFYSQFGVSSLIAGSYQILVVLSTALCSFIGEGSISVLNYADRFVQFVTGVVGVSLGTVFFAKVSAAKETSSSNQITNTALISAYLASFYFLGLFWLIGEFAFVIFFGAQFYELPTKDSLLLCLKVLAMGLPFYLVNIILSRKLFSDRRHFDNFKISLCQIVAFLSVVALVYYLRGTLSVEVIAAALTFSNFSTFVFYVLKSRDLGWKIHLAGFGLGLFLLLCGSQLATLSSYSFMSAICFTIGFVAPALAFFVFFKRYHLSLWR